MRAEGGLTPIRGLDEMDDRITDTANIVWRAYKRAANTT